jgi:hypothetical protein
LAGKILGCEFGAHCPLCARDKTKPRIHAGDIE